MRLKQALIFLCLFPFSFFTHGQDLLNQKVDFNVTNISIMQALDELSAQAGIDIAYSSTFFKDANPISINEKDITLNDALKIILKGTIIDFKAQGKSRILLFKIKVEYVTLSGYVEDQETGERIIGARIYMTNYGIGAITNEYGFFSFKIPKKAGRIYTKSIGYKAIKTDLKANNSNSIILQLQPVEDLPTVIVDADRSFTEKLSLASVSIDQNHIIEISPRMAKTIPSLNGQTDYVRVAQLLPGIQAESDGFGGMNVRGGNTGQNLLLMDGTPIYIPYHLMGLYSIYNPEIVKSVKLIKGNFPSRYGGATSSILDVRIREGDLYNWKGSANINFLTAGALVEGPIKKGKGSFLFAARYSPAAYFFRPILGSLFFQNEIDKLNTTFYDVNLKSNYKISKKDRIYLSLFSGADIIEQNSLIGFKFSTFSLDWQNTVGSLRWNHLFSESLFLNTTFTFSNYGYRFSSLNEFEQRDPALTVNQVFVIDNQSTNIDLGLKLDFDYSVSKKHSLRYGLQHNYRKFSTNFYFEEITTFTFSAPDITPFEGELFNFDTQYNVTEQTPDYLINETSIYLEDQIKLRKWYFNLGARLSSSIYDNSRIIFIEPRLISKYRINKTLTGTFIVNKRVQYLHLISNPSFQFPNDLWIPSGNSIDPQELYEAEVSFNYLLKSNLSFNISAYSRISKNIYTYTDSIHLLFETKDYTNYNYLEKGEGRSNGIEFFVDYSTKKNGAIFSYTLAKVEHKYENINIGKWFPTSFDSRHQIKIALYHHLSKSFKIGANYIYNSPRPKTNIERTTSDAVFTIVDENPVGQKNRIRSKKYSRLDINLQFKLDGEKVNHQIKFGISNLMNTRNIAFYEFIYNEDNSNQYFSKEVNSLPILPSFSYIISFK